MTSPDGINWTIRTSAADNQWFSVCYGNGLFVAVSYDGSGNRVMTSPDGINWTIRTNAANNQWLSVCYGNGLFVAVANSGSGNRVMTSPDGINWTIRTSAADNQWHSVCYGNGLFVAVAITGSGNLVMTSGKQEIIEKNRYHPTTLPNGYTGINVPNPTVGLSLLNSATSGEGIAYAWQTHSSRRWKEHITPIQNALARICQLSGVEFDWKPENGGLHDIGLIAEDVGQVIPEIVSYEENGIDAKGVKYDHLVALLIEGMKEQQKQIEELKAAVGDGQSTTPSLKGKGLPLED
jgi:hypothetical protein